MSVQARSFHDESWLPEVDEFNFVPRVTLPVLMINGRYDHRRPIETSQLPMYERLGTPQADKDHKLFDGGHFVPRNDLINETLSWLDSYLGPVD